MILRIHNRSEFKRQRLKKPSYLPRFYWGQALWEGHERLKGYNWNVGNTPDLKLNLHPRWKDR